MTLGYLPDNLTAQYGPVPKRYAWDEKTGRTCWYPPDVREAVLAGPNRKLVIADYSQIEVRLIAFLSQEPALIKALNDKLDVHCFMAGECYGEPYDLLYNVVACKDKKHPRYNELSMMRSGVKTVTFGVPYGAGPRRIAGMIRLPGESMDSAIARATELIAAYFAKFVEIEFWLHEQRAMAQTEGYTVTVMGRRREYELPDRSNPDFQKIMSQIGRWAGNQPVQGSSADILKDAVRRLYRMHRGGKTTCEMAYNDEMKIWMPKKEIDANILLVCHDEIVTDTHEKHVERAEEMLIHAMTESYSSVSIQKTFRDKTVRQVFLKDIYNKVDAIVADYWSKD
jgi:DNA polymerase-1